MRFFVPGIPVAQGSKRHVGHGVMVEMGKGLAPWRDSIIWHAREQQQTTQTPRFDDGVGAYLSFTFPRPKSHFGTGKNAGKLKDSAPRYKTSAPDVDKLCRAVLDALVQAGVLRDDALVFQLEATKVYGEIPGVHVQVLPI